MLSTLPKNIIFYGVPGTGKTYKLQKLMENYTDTLTADTSYTLSELQNLSWREVICLVLLAENRSLTLKEIVNHYFVQQKSITAKTNSSQVLSSTLTNELHRFSLPASKTITRENINYASNHFFNKNEHGAWFILKDAIPQLDNLVYLQKQIANTQAKPIQIKRYSFVSFHQSYGYEEFVEGLRPVLDETSKQLSYQVQKGAFLKLCELAKNNPQKPFAFFIDEINRANVSKVFGELLTLIEADKREGMANEAFVKLTYSNTLFSVPSNVNIYATMNIADRSLTPLDSAMRRRFDFQELPPNPSLLAEDIEGVNLKALLHALNLRIAAILGPDFMLGHTPFLAINSIKTLNGVMQSNIIPLLQEYCFNDWNQIRLILADNQKPIEAQFIQENEAVKCLNIAYAKAVYMQNANLAMLKKNSYTPIYRALN